ncbi:hypothetical protein TNCV_4312271 [Trichonephila clavipes]|nr:hypothetical protein TNCV_4312271 [Trichonephila clavipes]
MTASTTLPPSLASSIPRFVTNRAYLGSFGTASWTIYEFGRTRGAFTTTVEPDVSGHHMEHGCINAHSYAFVLDGVQQSTKTSVHLYFFLR